MLTILLNKILFIAFFTSCLNIIRHTYFFVQTLFQEVQENEEPKKYRLMKLPLLLLAISIAYVLTSIFTGIKI